LNVLKEAMDSMEHKFTGKAEAADYLIFIEH
jgi:hypothetical protein